jgi:hypothetical protein
MCHYREISYPEWSGNRNKGKARFNPVTTKQEQGIGEVAPVYGITKKQRQRDNKSEEDIHKTN